MTRVVDLFVNVIFIIQKQTNIIFIFHIFKIMYTFASFSVTETSSTNDDIYMSSITWGEHCYFGGQKLLALVCLSDCIDKENKNSFKEQDSILNTFNIVDCSFHQLQMMFSGVLWEGYDKS